MKTNVNSSYKEVGIYLYVLLALLPMLLLRDFTPSNELRYLSIADEAIRDGHLFAFYDHGLRYADKPPLYLWIVMFGKWLLGYHAMWFLGLVSLLPAFVVTWVMNRWVGDALDEAYRSTATWALLVCGMFVGAAVVVRMDMLMCMFITLSLWVFYRMVHGEDDNCRLSILFPVFIFLAVFTKGPIGFILPFFSTTAYLWATHRLRTFSRYWGLRTWLILLAAFALWFGAVYVEGGRDYLHDMLFHQTIGRSYQSFHHRQPFYYYFLTSWYAFFPWSLLFVGVIAASLWHRKRLTDLQRFFLTVVVTGFLLLSVISSKIVVYLLPLFPFTVYLSFTLLSRYVHSKWVTFSLVVPAIAFALSFSVLRIQTVVRAQPFLDSPILCVAAILLTLIGVLALFMLYRRQDNLLVIRLMAGGVFFCAFVGAWSLPKLNDELGYANLCKAARSITREHPVKTYHVWGLHRPNHLNVYLNQKVHITPPDSLRQKKGVLYILPTDSLSRLPGSWDVRKRYRSGKYTLLYIGAI